MFCSQCGKKVLETMLFCPFCGSPIVVPEQESIPEPVQEPEQPAVSAQTVEKAAGEEQFVPLDLSGDWSFGMTEIPKPEPEPEFKPLDLSELDDEMTFRVERPKSEEISQRLASQMREEPVRLGGHVPDLTNVRPPMPEKTGARKPATFVPVREFNPDDIFLDGSDGDIYDEDEDDDYDYEEPEEGGFWIRHIRGVVALSLMVVVLAIVAGWTFSAAGQTALARANLAWKSDTYAQLAYEAYQSQNYQLSANYYERALARDADSYVYANSAGVAYYLAGDTSRAADMARRAIGIDPSRVDAYQLLMRLYPDVATRPWEISSLIQQGYQMTGDETLKME